MKRSRYYEVENILDKRQSRGKTEYLIKWKGYSTSESTWEPLTNLKNIKEIIQKFSSYEDIKGTYYSPVGDKSLIVTEYEDNKVLKVDKFNLKYVINSDLSYSKVG